MRGGPAADPRASTEISLAHAATAARAADARGAQDLVVLDLRERTLVTDYFVICTATSRVHLRALRDAVEGEMRKAGSHLLGREGDESSRWILMDYGDVIVHLLTEETRAYYRLERMWADATAIEIPGLIG